MQSSGYSGTLLAKKLGIKEGYIIRLINQPDYYFRLFADMPPNVIISMDAKIQKNFIHYFVTEAKEVQNNMPLLRKEIKEDGILWVSWYKKSARMPTDVTEDFIRDIALKNGLVDIKVCAVDELWSGLKLVIPVKDRKNHSQANS